MSFSLQAAAPRVFLWQRMNHAIYFARNILLAQFITPREFGVFATALNLASYVAILSAFEFRTAFLATRNLSEEQIRVQWSAEVILNLVTVFIGLLLAPWLETTRSFGIVAAMLCLLMVNLIEASFSTQLYLLERELHFPFLSKMYALVNLISFIICLCFAIGGLGWVALIIDRVVAAGLKGLILWTSSDWRPRFLLHKTELQYYWSFTSVLFLTGLLGKVLFGFDIYAIGKWTGSEATGIYSMATKWALLPMEFGSGFLAMMALSLYSQQSQNGLKAFCSSYTEITFHTVRFCLAIAVLMAIFMRDFFHVFYGSNWQTVPLVFWALLPYAIFRPLYQNVCQALQAQKELWLLFSVILIQSLFAVVLIRLFVSRGIFAVALIIGCVLAAGYIFLEIHLHRVIKHPIFFISAFPMLLASLGIGGCFLFPYGISLYEIGLRFALAFVYLTVAMLEWWMGYKRLSCPTPLPHNRY